MVVICLTDMCMNVVAAFLEAGMGEDHFGCIVLQDSHVKKRATFKFLFQFFNAAYFAVGIRPHIDILTCVAILGGLQYIALYVFCRHFSAACWKASYSINKRL